MIFSKDKVNTGRQTEFDLLKAFTVVFSMIIIHVFDFDAVPESVEFDRGLAWWLDDIFGGIFGAPIFMFCMGAGMEYSRNASAGQTALRGLKLLTIGQVLNFFRYELIFGLQLLVSKDIEYLPAQALNFSSDIMQFAGLSFLLMGLFRKLNLRNWAIFLVSAVMSIAGMMLVRVQTGCYAVDQFLGFFWGTDTESFFPLLSWFIFIAAGKWFGSFYQHVENKTAFFLLSAPVGIAAFSFVWYLQKHTSCGIFRSFDHYGFSWMSLQDSLSVILIIPCVIGLFYLFSRILPKITLDVLTHPSKHINQYYCVSWWWIMVVHLYLWANSTAALISVWLNVLALTAVTVVLYNNHLKESVETFCSRHRIVLTVLVWVLTLGAAFYAFAVCPELPNQFNDYLMGK